MVIALSPRWVAGSAAAPASNDRASWVIGTALRLA